MPVPGQPQACLPSSWRQRTQPRPLSPEFSSSRRPTVVADSFLVRRPDHTRVTRSAARRISAIVLILLCSQTLLIDRRKLGHRLRTQRSRLSYRCEHCKWSDGESGGRRKSNYPHWHFFHRAATRLRGALWSVSHFLSWRIYTRHNSLVCRVVSRSNEICCQQQVFRILTGIAQSIRFRRNRRTVSQESWTFIGICEARKIKMEHPQLVS